MLTDKERVMNERSRGNVNGISFHQDRDPSQDSDTVAYFSGSFSPYKYHGLERVEASKMTLAPDQDVDQTVDQYYFSVETFNQDSYVVTAKYRPGEETPCYTCVTETYAQVFDGKRYIVSCRRIVEDGKSWINTIIHLPHGNERYEVTVSSNMTGMTEYWSNGVLPSIRISPVTLDRFMMRESIQKIYDKSIQELAPQLPGFTNDFKIIRDMCSRESVIGETTY